jgi:hypothetical protein
MFDDWDFATRFRDTIASFSEGAVERLRPAPRYATVVTIDRVGRTCTVRFPGETATTPVTVPMGSIQPSKAGQVVRVAGTLGDRYIDDVMGEAVFAGGTPVGAMMDWPVGVAAPAGYIAADGRYLDPSAYPSLFTVYGFSQGQQGQQFRVPTSAGKVIRAT